MWIIFNIERELKILMDFIFDIKILVYCIFSVLYISLVYYNFSILYIKIIEYYIGKEYGTFWIEYLVIENLKKNMVLGKSC